MSQARQPSVASPLQSDEFFNPMPYEVDFTGFLSNTVAPRWMERLRLKLIEEHFSDQRLLDRQQLSVIARSEIDYVRPVRMGMTLCGRARVVRCMRSSWTIEFVFDDAATGQRYMRALQTGAFIDPITFAPVRIPYAIQERIVRALQLQDQHYATTSHT